MPPQKLSVFPPSIQIILGGKAALARPDLAAIAAEIIAHSADTEAQFGGVLVSLLGAQAAPAAAMFYSLNNSHSQRQAVKAAMREALGEQSEELKILKVLMRGSAVVAVTRNKLAHWGWAYSRDIPKALLFVDPEALISHDMVSGQMQAPHDGRVVISPIDRERILVFFWEDVSLRRRPPCAGEGLIARLCS